jgi:ADP-ribose pyrophosphatase
MPIWKSLSRTLAFDAAPFLRVFRETVEIAPGLVIDDFWQVELRSFAVVVPVLPDGRVLVLNGYRHGPRRECLSFPGGFLDPGEVAEDAARRELGEEAGLVPTRLIPLGNYIDNGNQRGGHGHYFLALGCRPTGDRLDEPTEAGGPEAMTSPAVDAMLDQGRFGVIHHVAGWCLARRHPDFPVA